MLYKSRLILLVMYLLACLLGCNADPDVFDISSLPAPKQAVARAAMQDWCESSAGVCPKVGEQAGSKVVLVHSLRAVEGADMLGTVSPSGGFFGFLCYRCLQVTVLDSLEEEALRKVLRHELGHHFGCMVRGLENAESGNTMALYFRDMGDKITEKDALCVREKWTAWH